jgi:hypothetical protein
MKQAETAQPCGYAQTSNFKGHMKLKNLQKPSQLILTAGMWPKWSYSYGRDE